MMHERNLQLLEAILFDCFETGILPYLAAPWLTLGCFQAIFSARQDRTLCSPITLQLAPVSRIARPWVLETPRAAWLARHSADVSGFNPDVSIVGLSGWILWHGCVSWESRVLGETGLWSLGLSFNILSLSPLPLLCGLCQCLDR